MSQTRPQRDPSTSRPIEGPPALPGAQSFVRRADCLPLVAPTDLDVRRRSRVADARAAGELTIRSTRDHGTHLVAPLGELDVATVKRFADELQAVEATDPDQITLDLSGLKFMDSSGVHLIARVAARCQMSATRLRLLPGPPHIRRVLTLAGADTLPVAA